MKTINTKKVPLPAGHYAQAVVHENIVYVAGQLPISADGTKIKGSIEEESRQVLANIKEVLFAAGSDVSKILRVCVYITDIENWTKVNEIYADFLGDHKAARTIVPVKELHYGFSIEMDCIAYI